MENLHRTYKGKYSLRYGISFQSFLPSQRIFVPQGYWLYLKRISSKSHCGLYIKLSCSLQHPNLISFVEHITTPHSDYLLLEYADQGSLAEYIDKRREAGLPLTLEEVLWVLVPVLSAVNYVHDQGYLHGDLKTSNVLLLLRPGRRGDGSGIARADKELTVKLADFGKSFDVGRVCDLKRDNVSDDIFSDRLEGDKEAILNSYPSDTYRGCFEYEDEEGSNEEMEEEADAERRREYYRKLDAYGVGLILFELLTLDGSCRPRNNNPLPPSLSDGEWSGEGLSEDVVERLRSESERHYPNEMLRLVDQLLNPKIKDRLSVREALKTDIVREHPSLCRRKNALQQGGSDHGAGEESQMSSVSLWTSIFTEDRTDIDVEKVTQCVKAGADVQAPTPGWGCSYLHYFTLTGSPGGLRACLETPQPLNFCATDSSGNTLLHLLCGNHLEDESVRLLSAVVDRLLSERGRNDLVDWDQRNLDGDNFINAAAFSGKLCALWSVVKEVPYFAGSVQDLKEGIPTRCQILLWRCVKASDWAKLVESGDDMYFHRVDEESAASDDATLDLWYLCSADLLSVYPEKMIKCLRDGADPTFVGPGSSNAFLHHFIRSNNINYLQVFFEHAPVLDFTVRSVNENHPLLYIGTGKTADKAENMLKMILERFRKHPGDRVDWFLTDEPDEARQANATDLTSISARWGLLSNFFAILRRENVNAFFSVPPGETTLRRLRVTHPVLEFDWMSDRLSDEDRRRFDFVGKKLDSVPPSLYYWEDTIPVLRASRPTWNLYRLLMHYESNDGDPIIADVERELRSKADVMFQSWGRDRPLVFEFALHGLTECVERCLSIASGDLNWEPLSNGESMLDCICHCPDLWGWGAGTMLRMFVKRLKDHPAEAKTVQWGAKNADGLDFVNAAARCQLLSRLVPELRKLPYFAALLKDGKRMEVEEPVWRVDWDKLDDEDKACLLVKGDRFIEEKLGDALLSRLWMLKSFRMNADEVEELISVGADVMRRGHGMKLPFLHECVKKRMTDVVKRIARCAEEGTNFFERDADGNTLLHWVVKGDANDLVKSKAGWTAGDVHFTEVRQLSAAREMLIALLPRLEGGKEDGRYEAFWGAVNAENESFRDLFESTEGLRKYIGLTATKMVPYYRETTV